MKLLILILAFPLAMQGQKTVTVPNLISIYDTSSMEMKVGTHKLVIRKSINKVVSYDTVSIQVIGDSETVRINYLPIADAGPDAVWTVGKTATISGKGYDRDGKIVGWYWQKVSGPRYGKISYNRRQTTTLTGLVKGTYIYRLTVTDDHAGTGEDLVVITIK